VKCLNVLNGVAGYLYVLLLLEKKVRRIKDNDQEATKETKRAVKKQLHDEIAQAVFYIEKKCKMREYIYSGQEYDRGD
jgi:hypothetical protein